VSETLNGLECIRAYNSQGDYVQEHEDRLTVASRVYFAQRGVESWVGTSFPSRGCALLSGVWRAGSVRLSPVAGVLCSAGCGELGQYVFRHFYRGVQPSKVTSACMDDAGYTFYRFSRSHNLSFLQVPGSD
jgi:hypothetical protein